MIAMRESTARTRELGRELRRIRESARYTGHELATKLGWSPSKISRMETGDRTTSEVDVAVYAAFCGAAGDELDHVLQLTQPTDDNHWLHVRGDHLPDELRSVIILENTAQTIAYYEPIVIPGLLQTEDYARALFHERDVLPLDAIDSRVRFRMARQHILALPNPPKITFFVHENALRMPVGNLLIMHEQMLHLLLTCATPQCRLRVVEASVGARTGANGPFMWTAHRNHNPVIYVEHLTTSMFLEGIDETLAYRRQLDRLSDIALDEGQSRQFLADLASEYDREEADHEPPARPGPELAQE
ncbi:MAG TPA: helix-turn-helix transcriptional regulator [Actinophytocola sp.]|jgi:transcriptional regulator with XRE-family HTH domain|uniref:helix-turn-helix domain-containing protein n=1 Tax=Actinophytocola sp. TaxID=1872138 RepID=UPI002DFFB21B|nr:helix-turn-helix transcriptional regulator [Actinophytocola sp.]